MNQLLTSLQVESYCHLNAFEAIVHLQAWMHKTYPAVTALSASLIIKECLRQIEEDKATPQPS